VTAHVKRILPPSRVPSISDKSVGRSHGRPPHLSKSLTMNDPRSVARDDMDDEAR
jgi:hypothetical protein